MRPLIDANDTVIRFTMAVADSGLLAIRNNERAAKTALNEIPAMSAINFFDLNGSLFKLISLDQIELSEVFFSTEWTIRRN